MLGLKTILYAGCGWGAFLGIVPALIRRFAGEPFQFASPGWMAAGIAAVAAGVFVYVVCAWDFVRNGRGTPGFWDPPSRLVTSPLFLTVRNPMYVGVVLAAFGEALIAGSGTLVMYSAGLALGFHAFVIGYEEPTLRRSFGPQYDEYASRVGRWLPKRKGFTPFPIPKRD